MYPARPVGSPGVIGLRVVSVGDYVKEGADIVNLESIDPLKVDFRVPEIYLRHVQEGQTLTVTLDALPGKKFEGKVFAVNPLIDAAGRAVVIRALVRNIDTSLRPGMFARVNLITRAEKEALMSLLFTETTTLGIRSYEVERRALCRSVVQVETQYGPIDVKVAHLNGRVVNEMPEFEQCREAAIRANVPLKVVEEAARVALAKIRD